MTWFCDTCGELILLPEDGWLEWIDLRGPFWGIFDETPWRARDMRIVHHLNSPFQAGCQFDREEGAKDEGSIGDGPLIDFLGDEGRRRLAQLNEDWAVPPKEFEEVIKRLHLPGYEHSRHRG